jgi:hypothetical protein
MARSWLGVAGVLLSSLALVSCAEESSSSPDTGPAPPATFVGSRIPTTAELRAGTLWKGEFTIDIEVWDLCTTFDAYTKSDSYTKTESFSVQTAGPVDNGPGRKETNEFFLSAGTDVGIGGPVGLALQSTGVVALPGQEDDPLILQYWTLSYDDGHLSGELTEDGTDMGLGFNSFQDDDTLVDCQPFQGMIVRSFRIKEGATIEADFDGDSLSMTITGRSTDQKRRFRVDATATRVE